MNCKPEINLYELELHQQVNITARISVTRVPGGWIYTFRESSTAFSTSFVPFNNEYMGNNDCLYCGHPKK